MNIIKHTLKTRAINKIVALTLPFFLALSSACDASFEKAMEIYQSGKYVEAKIAFEAMAAIGDRSSLFNLGVMYYRGEASEKDPVSAYVLMTIANEGLENKEFAKITQSIFKKLSAEQKNQAEVVYTELEPRYGIGNIRKNIFPKPLTDENCVQKIVAKTRVPARYPRSQSNTGQMGLTRAEYTISPEGYPRDIIVVASSHKDFTKSTVKSVSQFTYDPPADKNPIYNHRINVIYQMANDSGDRSVKTKVLVKELDALKTVANSGNPIAQFKYGQRLNVFRYFDSYLSKIDLQYSTANEWFTKSANSGLPHAQFEIGRNMLEGRGCEVDKVNGYKWINAAAIGGYPRAQRSLAQLALSEKDISQKKSLAAISWLRNASIGNSYPAKVLLAWELSTSSEGSYRNGKEALILIKAENDNYFDKLRVLETKAAANAEMGNFKKAVKFQKKAVKIAKKFKWTIPLISERLALYEQGNPYRGSYY